jgi:plasmid replication initiation protein
MARQRLSLKTRDEFADLSLHEKNAYLHDIAVQVAQARGEELKPLDKESLARLRRFYARRSLADLKAPDPNDPLGASLLRLAEAIRTEEIQKVVQHEVSTLPKPMVRAAPIDDAQMMFFVPSVHDAPVKDDLNLMDIAPFALSRTSGEGTIRYELKDSIITIEGGAEVGLATAYDYDIFINMVSHLAQAVRNYRIDDQKGLRPGLPARVYSPSAAEILKFCRRELGGKQYLDLEHSLDRLQATRIKITNLGAGKRRETQSFPLIGRYRVVTRTTQERIDKVEIEIPNWVYEGVVKADGSKPSILTLHPDYFLIARPIAKFIYRLARKAAGYTEAGYGLAELHRRSGSKLPAHKFKQAIQEIVNAAKDNPLPDYDLTLEEGKGQQILRMRYRAKKEPQALLDTSEVVRTAVL